MILFAKMRIRFGAKQVYSTHQQFVLFLHSLVDVISKAIHVISNGVDVISKAIHVISNAVDVISNGVDVISKAIHVSSNAVDVISTAVDVISNAVDISSNGGKQFLSLYMSPVHYFLHTIEPLHQGKDGRLSIGDIIGELLR